MCLYGANMKRSKTPRGVNQASAEDNKKTTFSKPTTAKEVSPSRRLRRRKSVKYLESSLEVSKTDELPAEKKVPVYKQPLKEKTVKRKGDLYEFEDFEKHTALKKKKSVDLSYNNGKTIKKKFKNLEKPVKTKANKICKAVEKVANKTATKPNTKPKDRGKRIIHKLNSPNNFQKPNEWNPVVLLKKIPFNKAVCSSKSNGPEKNIEETSILENEADHNISQERIHIVSNIQLPPHVLRNNVSSPTLFKDSKPNANSTMIASNVLTPWRFNEINIRRNPHFLLIKQSSLPSISQDMILDHTVIDKMNDSLNENVKSSKPIKKSTQTSIDNFINFSKNEDKENHVNLESSLFDYNELSPVKKTVSFNHNVKKRILGERNSNLIETNTTQNVDENRQSDVPDDLNQTFFGFDETQSEETSPLMTNKENRPFRISIKVPDKKYERKIKRRPPTPIEVTEEENSDNESDGETERDVRLFEDFECTLDPLEEEKRLKAKSKRTHWNADGQKKKRQKDLRTKEEEEEAEKWAAAFNSMCEEVEQFPLEIE